MTSREVVFKDVRGEERKESRGGERLRGDIRIS